MRILFVENHDKFASVVTKQFLGGHSVTRIPTVAEAWTELDSSEFEVALIDYDLDDGTGDELVRQIRDASLPVKIVAVSSHDRGNNALVAAGADTICGKMEFTGIGAVLNSLVRS